MNIESFEPYHIGMKLIPDIDLNILMDKIKNVLEQKEYEVTKESKIEKYSIKVSSPTEILGIKNDVTVELNFAAQALNVIGKNPSKVLNIFEEIQDYLPAIGYEINASALFYEILSTIIIKTDKNPIELLNKSTRLDCTTFKEINHLGVIGLKIGSMETDTNWLNLIIEPNKTSPNSRFSVQLQFRSKERDQINVINDVFETRILEIVQSLERDV